MRHRVARVVTNIEGQAITVLIDPLVAGDDLCGEEHRDQLRLVATLDGACIDDMAARHDQHMSRSDRDNVTKRNDEFVFENSGAGYCSCDDLAEQTVRF